LALPAERIQNPKEIDAQCTERNMKWVIFRQKCEKYSSGANKTNVFLPILVHF